MDYRTRQNQLLQSEEISKCDVFLVTHLPNVRYLCGFTGSSGVLALAPSGSVLFTDGRYTEQARTEVAGARVVIVRKSPLAGAAEWLLRSARRKSGLRAGIESEHLTVASRALLMRLLSPRLRLRNTAGVVERRRMVKDAEELARIRAAAKLGTSLLQAALPLVRPGTVETTLAAEMEYAARQGGAEEMSFPTIVAAGPRSALPHAHASANPVPRRGTGLAEARACGNAERGPAATMVGNDISSAPARRAAYSISAARPASEVPGRTRGRATLNSPAPSFAAARIRLSSASSFSMRRRSTTPPVLRRRTREESRRMASARADRVRCSLSMPATSGLRAARDRSHSDAAARGDLRTIATRAAATSARACSV